MMNALLLLLFLIIFYAYLGYPLGLALYTMWMKKREVKEYGDDQWPTVSLLIAAFNEEESIAMKIENSLELDYPADKLEIVIVSDGSTDGTDNIVRTFRDKGIKLFRVEGRVGKIEARNQAVLSSRSEIIVFSDATAVYEKDVIKKMVRNFQDEKVGMVSGSLKYFDAKKGAMGVATKVYWKYESSIKEAQSSIHTLTGVVGCLNAFRRKLYYVLPPNIIEDFAEPLMIISQGYRVVYEKEAISYERTTQKASQEFKMRVRVIRGGMRGFLFCLKHLNVDKHKKVLFQLVSHKVLRWIMPLLLITFFFLSTVSTFTQETTGQSFVTFIWVAQILFYSMAALATLIPIKGVVGKIISIPLYFVVLNIASLRALYMTMTTELEATWETNIY
jgi:cellulose synthase/poly-beta-1,6-N-acetylglucosamine synthase-like glycosyltransferase